MHSNGFLAVKITEISLKKNFRAPLQIVVISRMTHKLRCVVCTCQNKILVGVVGNWNKITYTLSQWTKTHRNSLSTMPVILLETVHTNALRVP